MLKMPRIDQTFLSSVEKLVKIEWKYEKSCSKQSKIDQKSRNDVGKKYEIWPKIWKKSY